MAKWEHRNLQVKTAMTFGGWSSIPKGDLDRLQELQDDGWEVHHVVNLRGSAGFTSHVLFMLRREVPA
jgi:hypothetical protein